MTSVCSICGRELDLRQDPLSENCGGDCWGCIGEIEADLGYSPSLDIVGQEFSDGLRPDWIPSPNVIFTCKEKIKNGAKIEIVIGISRPCGEPWKN